MNLLLTIAAGITEAILVLVGTSGEEDLDETVIEHFEDLHRHPIRINSCPKSKLLSCGLMSAYQVASVIDYREHSGDILSITELGAVDGFGEETARALSLFVSLEASSEKKRPAMSLESRCQIKRSDICGGVKLSFESGGIEFHWSTRTTFSSQKITPGTFSLAFYTGKWKTVFGDFNARLGQGISMWSGFSMSGFSGTGNFRKNATGFSTTGSFSGGLRGVASEYSTGLWTFGAAAALPGLRDRMDGDRKKAIGFLPAFYASRLGKSSKLGINGIFDAPNRAGCISTDASVSFSHVTAFGEAALQIGEKVSAAALAGVAWIPEYGRKLCALGRWYPASFSWSYSGSARSATKASDEFGAALGYSTKNLTLTADAAFHPSKKETQCKLLGTFSPSINTGDIELSPMLRVSGRLKPQDKTQNKLSLRSQIGAGWKEWRACGRVEWAHCKAWAWVAYLEAGKEGGDWNGGDEGRRWKWSAMARWTLFKVDNWDDRIYTYERDIKGAFSIPAYYGRGWKISALASVKTRGRRWWHDLGILGSYIQYPWGLSAKAPQAEFKLQYMITMRGWSSPSGSRGSP